VFAETLYQGKLFFTSFAEILISWHVFTSIKELFLLLFFNSIVMKWDKLSSIVDVKIKNVAYLALMPSLYQKRRYEHDDQDIDHISFADRNHGKDGIRGNGRSQVH
jgi:hypothetical protein